MKVSLAYGQGHLTADLPDNATVVEPRFQPGLLDEHGALLAALESPIGCKPLRESLRPGGHISIPTPLRAGSQARGHDRRFCRAAIAAAAPLPDITRDVLSHNDYAVIRYRITPFPILLSVVTD